MCRENKWLMQDPLEKLAERFNTHFMPSLESMTDIFIEMSTQTPSFEASRVFFNFGVSHMGPFIGWQWALDVGYLWPGLYSQKLVPFVSIA